MKLNYLIEYFITSLLSKISYSQSEVIDVIATSEVHTELVATIKAADLIITLKGDGSLTVFAPNNMVFDKLTSGTLEELLSPLGK